MKSEQKMTINEAIEQGYKHFCEDGGEIMLKLSDYQKEGVDSQDVTYWLIDKEPTFYRIDSEDICDAIVSIPENQEEFGDEDGHLCDIVNDLFSEKPELFNAISEALNEKYKKKKFYVPIDIEVI